MHLHLLPLLGVLDGNGTAYKLLLLGHIFCVIVGIGSTFVYPFFGIEASKRKGVAAAAMNETAYKTAKIITTPLIYGAGIFGLLLVALGPIDWSDVWVQASLTLYVIAILFAAFVHVPNLSKMVDLGNELAGMGAPPAGASGPPAQALEMERRGKDAGRNGGILHLLITAIIVLMVFKPR